MVTNYYKIVVPRHDLMKFDLQYAKSQVVNPEAQQMITTNINIIHCSILPTNLLTKYNYKCINTLVCFTSHVDCKPV